MSAQRVRLLTDAVAVSWQSPQHANHIDSQLKDSRDAIDAIRIAPSNGVQFSLEMTLL